MAISCIQTTNRTLRRHSVESLSVSLEARAPHIDVRAVDDGTKWTLMAYNECLCTVEFGGRILEPHNLNVADGATFHKILAPKSQEPLMEIAHTAADGTASARLTWQGNPRNARCGASNLTCPIVLRSRWVPATRFRKLFRCTSPTRHPQINMPSILHCPTALPWTRLARARSSTSSTTSISLRRLPAMMDQANMVEILHDDGTIAVYAHLHWDSVRVQPGQFVRRGEYIANSGNTGFSTGAHLHFAVIRNSGLAAESVPDSSSQGPGRRRDLPADGHDADRVLALRRVLVLVAPDSGSSSGALFAGRSNSSAGLPCSTIWPRSMNTTRSAICLASAISCVTQIMVMPTAVSPTMISSTSFCHLRIERGSGLIEHQDFGLHA
jgi:hypothetical protein